MGCLCVVCKQCVYARKKSVIKNSLKRYSKQLNESKTKKYRKKSVFEWHINFFVKKWYKTIAKKTKKEYCICTDNYGGIAQLVRALASHARGRRFESYCLYHLITNILIQTKGFKMNDICPRIGHFLFLCVLLVYKNWFKLMEFLVLVLLAKRYPY